MQILYAVTLVEPNNPASGLLHKIKFLATDQVEALRLASEKARELDLVVYRVEELQVVNPDLLGAVPSAEIN